MGNIVFLTEELDLEENKDFWEFVMIEQYKNCKFIASNLLNLSNKRYLNDTMMELLKQFKDNKEYSFDNSIVVIDCSFSIFSNIESLINIVNGIYGVCNSKSKIVLIGTKDYEKLMYRNLPGVISVSSKKLKDFYNMNYKTKTIEKIECEIKKFENKPTKRDFVKIS